MQEQCQIECSCSRGPTRLRRKTHRHQRPRLIESNRAGQGINGGRSSLGQRDARTARRGRRLGFRIGLGRHDFGLGGERREEEEKRSILNKCIAVSRSVLVRYTLGIHSDTVAPAYQSTFKFELFACATQVCRQLRPCRRRRRSLPPVRSKRHSMPLYTGQHKGAASSRNQSPLLVASNGGGAAHSLIASAPQLPFSLNNTPTPTAAYLSEPEEEVDYDHEPVSWSTICCGWSEHYCWYWWGAVVFGVGAIGYVVSSTYALSIHIGTRVMHIQHHSTVMFSAFLSQTRDHGALRHSRAMRTNRLGQCSGSQFFINNPRGMIALSTNISFSDLTYIRPCCTADFPHSLGSLFHSLVSV
jgi:hypothetical protein